MPEAFNTVGPIAIARLPKLPSFLAAACLALLFAAGQRPLWAQAGAVDAQIDAHLQAGEFAPAIALAQALGDQPARDRGLAQVAAAQARSGMRRAALDTAGYLADDRLRSGTIDQIAQQPRASSSARGGGTMADFDTLIDLITATIAPQTWDDVGGPGAVDGFPGGVFVDATGVMKRLPVRVDPGSLEQLRQSSRLVRSNRDPRVASPLRKVSLPRLEKHLQMRWALGQEPTSAMRHLAGLQKVQYVFLYPESGDVVLAGEAGDWTLDPEGRMVSVEDGRPVLHLDDLVVLLRNAREAGDRFTCSITPQRDNLAAAQAYLNRTAKSPLKPGQTQDWLDQLRQHMGQQIIEVTGLDARSRVARVIVEADYRMKLVGMGLEDGVLGVKSYLDSIPADQPPPAMSVLRWWFTMNYAALQATPERNAFQIRGQGVQVLSENELLTQRGERIHTGQSDELNTQFAHSFTKHFPSLAAKYPVYADLQNVFDLALVAALLVAEDLPGQADWHLLHLSDPQRHRVLLAAAPTSVETVVSHRQLADHRIVAGVSGGVSVDSRPFVSGSAIQTDDYGTLQAEYRGSLPENLPPDAWWWD